jgi:GT2 family glycosyltransferase
VSDAPSDNSGSADPAARAALDGRRRGRLAALPRRIALTWHYLGPREVALRVLTFPLRFTPLKRRLPHGEPPELRRARVWYRRSGRPVTVVIPSYRDAADVARLVRSIRRTTRRGRVDIVVSDDASGPEHLQRLGEIKGITVIAGEENRGFAANVNRGLRAADPAHDVVILNSDMEAQGDWLACLQYSSREPDPVGIVGAKLLYPDGRIQFGGTIRNRDAPEWFDHRYRGQAAGWGPANITGVSLAVTGACMYVRRECIERIGLMDEDFPMAYEDVDWCLRCWQAGMRVVYQPHATLVHFESATRGTEPGARERASQRHFWAKWGEFLDVRPVHTEDGRLRVVYVTEGTGVGGGHRDIFEHLNRLRERGHEVALYSLDPAPDWFDLRVPVHTFEDYVELTAALAPLDAIKVATWWNTASAVWTASVCHGIPVYFVQDIETSYYPDDERTRHAVLDSYRPEFRYMTISGWNRDRLRELGNDAELIPPGIDLEMFRPRDEVARRDDVVLTLGRTNPLKNLPLTIAAWRALPAPRPTLQMFGIEPELAGEDGMAYEEAPSDERVAELLAEATIFILTSTHEGFALPPLESMATGGAVVCTDAHGNRDFCRDGENCLLVDAEAGAVTAALKRLLDDPALRERLGAEGIRTAADYAWPLRIDALEAFLHEAARPRVTEPSTDTVPGLKRTAR